MMSKVPMRDVFKKLELEEDWNAMAEEQPGYIVDLGNINITINELTGKNFRTVFIVCGTAENLRGLKYIEYELPLYVESFEQGVALIAYAIGSEFKPAVPASWLEQGLIWKGYLPWEKKMSAHAARPACFVQRDWFRIASKKMMAAAESAQPTDEVSISFDGQVVKITSESEVFAMPATGSAWGKKYFIGLKNLHALPKRLSSDTICIDIWENYLTIDRVRFPLTKEEQADNRAPTEL